MATLLDGKLYVKTFSILYVDCNGHVVFIVKLSWVSRTHIIEVCLYVRILLHVWKGICLNN